MKPKYHLACVASLFVGSLAAQGDLTAALKSSNVEERLAALAKAATSTDPKVARAVSGVLRSGDEQVRLAAADALGRMPCAAATAVLHDAVGAKGIAKDETMLPAVLKAIARRGAPESIAVLGDKPLSMMTFDAIRARIWGLANIRSEESVDRLIQMTTLGGRVATEKAVFMDDGRAALAILTGIDNGASKVLWGNWRRDHFDAFTIDPKRPPVAEIHRLRWEAFFGEPYVAESEPPPKVSPQAMTVAEADAALKGGALDRQLIAAEVLGRTDDQSALAVLHKAARNAKLEKSREVFPAVLKAIGRRGDKSSVPILASKPTSVRTYQAIIARIYGLANVRDASAVDKLVGFSKIMTPAPNEPFTAIEDFRTAMVVLTGLDHGPSKILWQQWWQRAKKSFEVPPARPVIAKTLALRWESFWSEPYVAQRTPPKAKAPAHSTAADAAKALGRAATRADAIHSLDLMDGKEALDALHRAAGSATIRKDQPAYASVLRAIARKGDPSSVDVLAAHATSVRTFGAVRARIFGLANIRTRASAETLMALMKLESAPPGEAFVFAEDFRTAMVVLTGVDNGAGKFLWQNWWKHHGSSFEPSAEAPDVPRLHELVWAEYWGAEYPAVR